MSCWEIRKKVAASVVVSKVVSDPFGLVTMTLRALALFAPCLAMDILRLVSSVVTLERRRFVMVSRNSGSCHFAARSGRACGPKVFVDTFAMTHSLACVASSSRVCSAVRRMVRSSLGQSTGVMNWCGTNEYSPHFSKAFWRFLFGWIPRCRSRLCADLR